MAIVEVGLDIDAWKAAMIKTLGSQFAPQLDSLYLQSLKQFEQELQMVDAASVKATAAKSKTKRTPRQLVKDSPALAKMINQLRESITGGLNWKQIFTSTAIDQRKWEMDTYAQIRQHPALQALDAEQAKQLTRELSKAWQTQRRTVWKRELDRTLIKAGMAKPKLRAKIAASAPRLLALINLGALDARTFRDAVAKEFGLRSMNDSEVVKVKESAWYAMSGAVHGSDSEAVFIVYLDFFVEVKIAAHVRFGFEIDEAVHEKAFGKMFVVKHGALNVFSIHDAICQIFVYSANGCVSCF